MIAILDSNQTLLQPLLKFCLRNMNYIIPHLPLTVDVETKAVMRQSIMANKRLAELKGISLIVPNPSILIRTLSLQEAKDSSAIESIITTHDDLYKAEIGATNFISPAAKEVSTYADALMSVGQRVRNRGIISNNDIIEIYRTIKHNDGGFTTTPGKALINERTGDTVYTPPQTIDEIKGYMANLEEFINNDEVSALDPLVKMAIIHHQFESIHPFGDGNGRAGRVINILYLVAKNLLDLPILYLSRYIIQRKGEYYNLLQAVRNSGNDNAKQWEDWILFILRGIEITAAETIEFVKKIAALMQIYKHKIRNERKKIYSQDLINNLFRHPYTKIDFVMDELKISRPTAISYLNQLIDIGLLVKTKLGRENFYVNIHLYNLIRNAFHSEPDSEAPVIYSGEKERKKL